LTLPEFKSISELFDEDVIKEVFDFEKSVERRDGEGGTSRRSVLEQCNNINVVLERK